MNQFKVFFIFSLFCTPILCVSIMPSDNDVWYLSSRRMFFHLMIYFNVLITIYFGWNSTLFQKTNSFKKRKLKYHFKNNINNSKNFQSISRNAFLSLENIYDIAIHKAWKKTANVFVLYPMLFSDAATISITRKERRSIKTIDHFLESLESYQ